MSITLTVPACDGCGDLAAYRDCPNEVGTADALCDDCARYRGAERRGEAYAALEALGFAVSLARGARLSDQQIREAFEATLTDPHSEGRLPGRRGGARLGLQGVAVGDRHGPDRPRGARMKPANEDQAHEAALQAKIREELGKEPNPDVATRRALMRLSEKEREAVTHEELERLVRDEMGRDPGEAS